MSLSFSAFDSEVSDSEGWTAIDSLIMIATQLSLPLISMLLVRSAAARSK